MLDPNPANVSGVQRAVMNRKKWLLAALVSISVVSAAVDGLFYWFDAAAAPNTDLFADFIKVGLLVLWVDADSKSRQQITRPFDYGFLLFLFWLPYLPYYFWRTRGPLGLLLFAGFLILLWLGWLVQVGVYLIRAEVIGF
jgi:hypothetical protein